ncbi:glycosyltransferase family 15 [Fusarium langsethiae]|uniref:Glycosyltransferase family 15 n=1 Tax=Fusarium langsethiae TaxID=179993 RepID=A0A0N0V7I7_FUSLA|nr:glycosyltransferase family 15 [Fusarium langsethiae]GKU01662.1 unnamed protein product [Fusarium langsethiae]GKU18065.1 unnamed protein product [Fusarium langsethiae]
MAKAPCSTLWWVGTVALFYFTLVVFGSALSLSTDHSVKAALVALVKDNDINATLFSIKQFDDNFNNRYLYDWVFFSIQDLPKSFKDSVSNATNATCIFEVIPEENWNDPGWVDSFQHSLSRDTRLDKSSAALKTIANIHQMNRWISAPFAKERRLKDYEWFLKVDPGAQLAQNISFDVFRFMRDNGITYGSSRAVFGQANLPHLSPRIKSFFEKHPDLLHKEANLAWLIENVTGLPMQSGPLDEGFEDLVDEGSDKLRSRNEASQIPGAQDGGEGSSWLGECFASWLADIHGNSLSPSFEIGSFGFFRSLNQVALFDHLDNAGDFQFRRVGDAPLHSLSASMLLPRDSVWNFRTKETKLCSQHDSEHTRAERRYSEKCMNNFDTSNLDDSAKSKGDACEAMTALLKAWDLMAQDVGAQSKSPKLISGNTWMGKMNGGAGCSFFWFWRKTLSDDLGFGWKVDLSCLHDGIKGQVKIKV